MTKNEIVARTDGRVLDREWAELKGECYHHLVVCETWVDTAHLKCTKCGDKFNIEEADRGRPWSPTPPHWVLQKQSYHSSLDLIHKEEKWLFGQRQEIKIEYGLNLLDLLVPNKFLLLNDEDVMLYQVDLPDIINADAMTRLKALILTMKEDR